MKSIPIDHRLPILGQPQFVQSDGCAESRHTRVPHWVHDDDVLRALGPEFADEADLPPDMATRRQFLQVMGASMALATASGCFNQPQEKIVPFVRPPEQIVPGKPLFYATAMTLGGGSMGLLVETHMGRPTKVEGNPLHPAVPPAKTLADSSILPDAVRVGATDAFAQALVLSLYDPDRSQTVLRQGQISTWDALYGELRTALERVAPKGGQGLRVLSPPVLSPTLADQLEQLLTQYPNARWHQYEPINDDNALGGARLAFGEAVTAVPIGEPEIVLSLDDDCFGDGPMRLQLARRIRGQMPTVANSRLPRMYVVETSSTITGAAADHRLPISSRGVVAFALAIARRLGLAVESGEEYVGGEIPQKWVDAVVEDLSNSRGRSFVLAGRGQPPIVQAVAHWLNSTLGNVGQTVEYRAPAVAQPQSCAQSIAELAKAMSAKEVSALIMLGGNPVYDAPADIRFSEALRSVPFSLHLSQYVDETSALAKWHVPEAHLFEAWSDTRAVDGTASIVQPLIAPLYEGRTKHELLAAVMGQPTSSAYDLLRAYWSKWFGAATTDANFERVWTTALHDGVIAGTSTAVVTPRHSAEFEASIGPQAAALLKPTDATNVEVVFRPDPSVWDGRFSNNGWLQELPRPFTKLTWDNAAAMSPRTASANGIRTGDIVEIQVGETSIEVPACVVPGHPDQTIALYTGYGRTRSGRVGNEVGANVYPLRTSSAAWVAGITNLRKTGKTTTLATTQHHFRMEGRNLVRAGTLDEYRDSPEYPHFMESHGHGDGEEKVSLYPEPVYEGYKWGMVVNQTACIGCNACVVACQSENNIPVVGKEQVRRGREMHWLRIDDYFVGAGDLGLGAEKPGNENSDPKPPAPSPQSLVVYHQPLMCVHCEYAPCEPVCPVAATTHSSEGLNEMTYNRCIGTRYCSNNCPYKVRRFNFFDYNAELREDPTMQLRPNPDVTVRSRGVMEKCTYCVQRINAGRIAADIENRAIYDGEVVTACQAACPTQVFSFGNLNDENSEVLARTESGLNYSLLGELNTRPRTTYLALVRNPNPKLS